MARIVRLSFSLENSLLDRLEALRSEEGYANRSEFLRDIIRAYLVRRAVAEGQLAVGALTIVYRHHQPGLPARLNAIQHQHEALIVSSAHVHLDHDHCLEVVLVRGPAEELVRLERELKKPRGVLHAELSLTASPEVLR